ncbi:MAG: hypothetical protein GWQ05_03745 [Verrucomicrobiaceae bacterium]|nr:hypothetical protein [Verrucomicrobiaceae bacterium]
MTTSAGGNSQQVVIDNVAGINKIVSPVGGEILDQSFTEFPLEESDDLLSWFDSAVAVMDLG